MNAKDAFVFVYVCIGVGGAKSFLSTKGRPCRKKQKQKLGTSDLIQDDFIKLYLVASSWSTSKSGNLDQ